MPSAEHCRALAEEADRLADVVSYGRDKIRLREQAETWRLKARDLETQPTFTANEDTRGSPRLIRWLRGRGS